MTLAVLATAGLVFAAAPVSNEKEAEQLARRAITEYNAGQFDAALKDATDAYLRDPKPGLLFNIGQCQRALHNWERAEFNFRRYLAEKPDAPNRRTVEGLIAEMQEKQKEEAAAKAAPPVVAPVIVEAPTPPAAAKPAPAPAAAVTVPAKRHHGHVLAITLGAVGLALLGFAAFSIAEVVAYNNSQGSGAAKGTEFSENNYQLAQAYEVLQYAAGGLGVAGITAAGFTW